MKYKEIGKRKDKTTTNYKSELIEAKREIMLAKYNIITPRDTPRHHRL